MAPASTPAPRAASAREIAAAGRSIALGSLLLQPDEHVVIVADAAGASIGRAVAASAVAIGAQATFLRLDTLGPRPHADLHPMVRRALAQAQASVLIVSFERGEFEMRSEFVGEATRRNLRHAHLVGVTEHSIVMGFAIDPRQVEALGASLRSRIRPDSELRVRSPRGTDLTVRCHARYRWIEHNGVIRPGMKENLPSGELTTCPGDAHGVYVADGSLGDGNGVLHAVLSSRPMTLQIEAGSVTKFDCQDAELLEEVSTTVQKSAYLDRIGLVGFGTNAGITKVGGDIFTDQKLPGFHLSLGMTFPPLTGATWSATNWIAFTAMESDVEIDGEAVMRAGKYLLP